MRPSVAQLSLLVLLGTAAAASAAAATASLQLFTYKVSSKTLIASDAEAYCLSLGGHLSSIQSPTELRTQSSIVSAAATKSQDAWLGYKLSAKSSPKATDGSSTMIPALKALRQVGSNRCTALSGLNVRASSCASKRLALCKLPPKADFILAVDPRGGSAAYAHFSIPVTYSRAKAACEVLNGGILAMGVTAGDQALLSLLAQGGHNHGKQWANTATAATAKVAATVATDVYSQEPVVSFSLVTALWPFSCYSANLDVTLKAKPVTPPAAKEAQPAPAASGRSLLAQPAAAVPVAAAPQAKAAPQGCLVEVALRRPSLASLTPLSKLRTAQQCTFLADTLTEHSAVVHDIALASPAFICLPKVKHTQVHMVAQVFARKAQAAALLDSLSFPALDSLAHTFGMRCGDSIDAVADCGGNVMRASAKLPCS